MAKIRKMYDEAIKPDGSKQVIYPITSTRAVYTTNNVTIDTILGEGYRFGGVVLPTDYPAFTDQRVFYGASVPGIYEHFGGIAVNGGEAVFLMFNGSTWSKGLFGGAGYSNLSGFKCLESISDLPLEETTLGYLIEDSTLPDGFPKEVLYVWVGENGDTLGGLYQNCGQLRGASAYETAVRNGYEGTEEQWLNDPVNGIKGNGIQSMSIVGEYSSEDSAVNTYRITPYVGEPFDFDVKNGKGITSVEVVGTPSTAQSAVNTYRITMSDNTTFDFQVKNGTGITTITETPSVANGGTNVIHITLSDGTSYDINVKNGTASDGFFATEALLTTAIPSPNVGDYAFVSKAADGTFPAYIYVCETAGTWTNSTQEFTTEVPQVSVSQNTSTGGYDLSVGGNTIESINPDNIFKRGAQPLADVLTCILDVKFFGDVEPYDFGFASQTIYSYSDADSTILVFRYNKGEGEGYTSVALTKSMVSSGLGVQRICVEGIRDNVYIVVTIDFDKLETIGNEYIGQISFADVCFKNNSAKYNEKVFNDGIDRYKTIALLTDNDSFPIGSIISVKVQKGANEFTHLKQRTSLTNYNSLRSALLYYSAENCFAKFLKVDNEDWVYIGSTDDSIHKNISGFQVAEDCSFAITKRITDIVNGYSEIYIKYNTGDLADGAGVLIGGLTICIWQYVVKESNRYNIYLSTNDMGGSRLVEFETIKFEPNTDYELYIKIYNGKLAFASLNGKQADFIDTETAIEASTRVGTYIGSINGISNYNGIIRRIVMSSNTYNDYVGLNILRKPHCSHANIVLQLEPQNIDGGYWFDISGGNNSATLIDYPRNSKTAVIYNEVSIKDNIGKDNLFNKNSVLTQKIVDSQYGKIYDWSDGTNGQVCAVAFIPVTSGKYYAIVNPYGWNAMYLIGVGNCGVNYYGNPTRGNIFVGGDKYAICKAEYVNNTDAYVDCLFFNLYRNAQTIPNKDETPLVYVYELDSADEAIELIRTQFYDRAKLPQDINIDDTVLNSNNIGTLSSAYKDMSFLVFGDSITANHGWTNYIANKLKTRNIYNVAIGGANLAGSYNGDGSPRNMIYQMFQCANSLGSICYIEGELIDGYYTKKIDCVIISMGFNDANNGRTIGELDGVKDVAWNTLAPASDDADFASVMAAFKYCLFYLKTTLVTGTIDVNGVSTNVAIDCRDAKFIYQTPIQTATDGYGGSVPLPQRLINFENGIKEIANYYSVPVICGRTDCGISREEELLYQDGKYLIDQIHPNAKGYIKLGEMNGGAIIRNIL